jgi:uncharacterized repeat protein (TIGR03803 family)
MGKLIQENKSDFAFCRCGGRLTAGPRSRPGSAAATCAALPSWWKTTCVVALLCAAAAIASPAQTFKTLVNFDGTNGAQPQLMSFVQGADGNLYGTTIGGGAHGEGTVFKLTPSGTLTTLYSFCAQTNCPDGAQPQAALVLGTDGNFYGTTAGGGANTVGTVFKITPEGTLTTLYSFDSTSGDNPSDALVLATNGTFYGTTLEDGANNAGGTVFSITSGGTLTTLYDFCAQTDCADGQSPFSGLIQATNGTFYDTTYNGGANSKGTVFSITSAGARTTLYSFCAKTNCTDGANPQGALVQATNGTFYGTTYGGGTNNDGTVFSITSGGKLTTLHSFDLSDGQYPFAALIQATNGTFYGTTYGGGANGYGTVFSITSGGKLTTLHSFDLSDGAYATDGLFQATNGTLYGTTQFGGPYDTCSVPVGFVGCGTIFSLTVGLGPFVETLPTSGNVGVAVTILGTDLTGATRVSFNGKAAKFTVVSSSEITTTVPKGATTGKVEVKTPSTTLSSNVSFRVP